MYIHLSILTGHFPVQIDIMSFIHYQGRILYFYKMEWIMDMEKWKIIALWALFLQVIIALEAMNEAVKCEIITLN